MSKNAKWKTIKEFPKYKISESGNIINASTNYPIKKTLTSGYHMVILSGETKEKRVSVHRLVAKTYLPNPKNLRIVDHIDNNKLNNHVHNLRWVSASDNAKNYIKNFAPKNPILQLDTKGNLIKEWGSTREILDENPNYRHNNLNHCILGKGRTAYGYVWCRKNPLVKKEAVKYDLAHDEIFKRIKKIDENDLSNYKVSNKGNVINSSGRFLSKMNRDGYICINLTIKPGVTKRYRVHRLVAITFIKNDDPDNKIHINHIDKNRSNNCVENLEWVTQKENNCHAVGKPVKAINPETGKVFKRFKTMREANKYFELSTKNPTIGRACKDPNRIRFGYKWAYDI
ncbi:HNH endonuclease [Moumouvirus australiensis]|uniref:HNH endonuclease n=1 Tax=Moumouvirus australiensis TaxID=2109587 RepID=A0A2P1ELL3_9VIRU|nr:HNH endonuclease [Moumouvirus australiensis]AVL94769.1 HNH endonuclease [Moumouvirus australiensis]